MVGNTPEYYGKLVSCGQTGSDSGRFSVPLTGVIPGTYTLEIFSEQANGDYYTDFAGEAVTMKVVISGDVGAVSDFSGTVVDSVGSAGNSHICGVFGGGFGVLGGLAAAGVVLARRKRRGARRS